MKSYGENYRTISLCIDSTESGVSAGRFYYPSDAVSAKSFSDLTQFFIAVEKELDDAGFLQSYTAKRSFTPISESASVAVARPGVQPGRIATFQIRLLFRQHASWQGAIRWVEGNAEESFRSVLELILLLNSVLSDK